MLNLKRTSLVVVGTRAHTLTKVAIDSMLSVADFGDVLVFTDDQTKLHIPGARHFTVLDWLDKKSAGLFYYSEAAKQLETEFGFFVEWDAGIHDVANWQDAFLAYDYIGAPWITNDNLKVGNGGFTIMSKRFSQWLCEPVNLKAYPVYTDWDVCRTQRPRIEMAGHKFTWAPADLAHDFSWELINPRSPRTFGYHGIFNWPDMIGKEETARRVIEMSKDPYLVGKLKPLMVSSSEWIIEAIGPEAFARYVEATKNTRSRANIFTPAQQLRQQLLQQQRRFLISQAAQQGGNKA